MSNLPAKSSAIIIEDYEVELCEESSLAVILEKKGVDCSYQCTGEVDEKGYQVMELRPIGNWKYYHNPMLNQWIFEKFEWSFA